MDQVNNNDSRRDGQLQRLASALRGGVIVLDPDGQIVDMHGDAVQRLDGGLRDINLSDVAEKGIRCAIGIVDVDLGGLSSPLCVVKQCEHEKHDERFDVIAAIENVMSDTSWLTRAIVEKLTAWRQARGSQPRSSDLDRLTTREREILALICDGKSDAEMGRLLNLSQNTVRNHVASLYRKIGVNRRSAAIIWARERGITTDDVLTLKRPPRSREQRVED